MTSYDRAYGVYATTAPDGSVRYAIFGNGALKVLKAGAQRPAPRRDNFFGAVFPAPGGPGIDAVAGDLTYSTDTDDDEAVGGNLDGLEIAYDIVDYVASPDNSLYYCASLLHKETGERADALVAMSHFKLLFDDREWRLLLGDDYAWPEGSELVSGQYDGPPGNHMYMIDVGRDGHIATVSGNARYVYRITGRVTDVQVSDDGSVTVTMANEEMYEEEFDDGSVEEGIEHGEQTIVFGAGGATCTCGGREYTNNSVGG